jgi:hypothetical protein
MTIFENVTCDVVNNGANEIEGFGRGCGVGILEDAVHVFRRARVEAT